MPERPTDLFEGGAPDPEYPEKPSVKGIPNNPGAPDLTAPRNAPLNTDGDYFLEQLQSKPTTPLTKAKILRPQFKDKGSAGSNTSGGEKPTNGGGK